MNTKIYTLSTGTVLTDTELYEAHKFAELLSNRENVKTFIDWEDSKFASIPEKARESFIENTTTSYNETKMKIMFLVVAFMIQIIWLVKVLAN